MTDIAIQTEGLTKRFGEFVAVDSLDLRVDDGTVVALLGPNGAGKSTTLRTISGVVRAEHGTISAFGTRIDRAPAYRIARMGIVHVPEGRGIFPSLSVRENLDMASTFADVADPVGEATQLFPVLGNRLRQTAGSLSGGEQQMLALARALMARPRLLMVDEISMGLAPLIVGQLFDALRSIAASGTSLLLVEQYVETALDLSDYVYVMEKGSLVDVGEPADMRSGSLAAAYLGGAA
jgi:branched-chain amino acid transport system ATP-binding protein